MAWAPDYAEVEDLRAWVRGLDTVDDAQLQLAITAASRAIDVATGRQFGQVAAPVARRYTPCWRFDRGRWVIEIDDLMDSTGLEVEITYADGAQALTAFDLEPVNAAADGLPYTRIAVDADSSVEPDGEDHEASVVALFGWTSVPAVVVNACYIQAARWSNRRDAWAGVAGSPDLGNELRLLAKLDPDVDVMLHVVSRLGRPR